MQEGEINKYSSNSFLPFPFYSLHPVLKVVLELGVPFPTLIIMQGNKA